MKVGAIQEEVFEFEVQAKAFNPEDCGVVKE